MSNILREVDEAIQDVRQGLSEEELLSQSQHKSLEHGILWLRNLAVGAAMILFLLALTPLPHSGLWKAAAYFLGAAAYFCEILLLTDCFRIKMPHREMFMAYCFGPMYILLGISCLAGH